MVEGLGQSERVHVCTLSLTANLTAPIYGCGEFLNYNTLEQIYSIHVMCGLLFEEISLYWSEEYFELIFQLYVS